MPIEAKKADFVRGEVERKLPEWEVVRDAVAGDRQVKSKKTAYLPRPNPADTSKEADDRYAAYLARAVFYEVTGRTLHGLSGMVFSEPPVVEVDALLEPLVADVDGTGCTLAQQVKLALEDVLSVGRGGVLVDYPTLSQPATRADISSGFVRPFMVLYKAEQIINWRTTSVNGRQVLTMLVLREATTEAEADGFGIKDVEQWRVFRRDGNSVTAELWRKNEDKELVQTQAPVPLTGSRGAPLSAIPFVFLGVAGNTPEPGIAPLYGLATLNFAHYRNSADFEEMNFMVGQPTPYVTGVSEQWAKNTLKGKVQLGSRAILSLPAGGSAGLLQVEANTLLKDAMDAKERQMTAIGARLVQERAVQRTATEAGMERQSEVSVLAAVAGNVALGYVAALKFANEFTGATKEPLVELNTEFATSTMPVTDRAQLVAEFQAGVVTFEEARDNLRAAGVVWEDNEAAKAKAEAAMMGAADASQTQTA